MIVAEYLINKTNNTINTYSIVYPPSFPIEKNSSVNLYKLYNQILDINNDDLNIGSSNKTSQKIKITKNNKKILVFITKDSQLDILPTITDYLANIIKTNMGIVLNNDSSPEEFSKITHQQYLDIYHISQDIIPPKIVNKIQKTSRKINNNIQIEITILDGTIFQFYQDNLYVIDITSLFTLISKIDNTYLFNYNKLFPIDGIYPIYIRVLDDMGNKVDEILNIIIDTQPPIINIIKSILPISNITTPEIIISSNEDGVLTSSLPFLETDKTIKTGENRIRFNQLPDNIYTNETITITDIANNQTIIDLPIFEIDTISPLIISKKQLTHIRNGLIKIEIVINNGIDVELYCDKTFSNNSNITDLFTKNKVDQNRYIFTKKEIYITGIYTIYIKTFDESGNNTTDLLEITIDITPSFDYIIEQNKVVGIHRKLVKITNQIKWISYMIINKQFKIK